MRNVFIVLFFLLELAEGVRRDDLSPKAFEDDGYSFYESRKSVENETPSSDRNLSDNLHSGLLIEGEKYLDSFDEVRGILKDVCHVIPHDYDPKVIKYERCSVCHVFVRQLRNALRNPTKQFIMIRILRGACQIFVPGLYPIPSTRGPATRECKRIVSEYAPIIFSSMRRSLKIVDLCHKMKICDGLCIMDE